MPPSDGGASCGPGPSPRPSPPEKGAPKEPLAMTDTLKTKKAMILAGAQALGAERFTPAEIEQLRRKLLAEHGPEGKTGSDYIAEVLKDAGLKVVLTQQEEAEEQYEEEFDDLLHFRTLEDAEVWLTRLDGVGQKVRKQGERDRKSTRLNSSH